VWCRCPAGGGGRCGGVVHVEQLRACGLTRRQIRLRVSSQPFDATGWSRQFTHDAPDALAGLGGYVDATTSRLRGSMLDEKVCLLGCGVGTGWGSAVNSAGVGPGQTVIVMGVGGIGINAVQGAAHAGATHVIADVVGWFSDSSPSGGALFNGITPKRIADTRPQPNFHVGPNATLGDYSTVTVQVAGTPGVPAMDAASHPAG